MPELVIPVLLILCTTAVLILRPLTTRLGNLLEALATERLSRAHRSRDDVSALLIALDDVQQRLRSMEDEMRRQGEQGRARPALPPVLSDPGLARLADRIQGPHSDGSA